MMILGRSGACGFLLRNLTAACAPCAALQVAAFDTTAQGAALQQQASAAAAAPAGRTFHSSPASSVVASQRASADEQRAYTEAMRRAAQEVMEDPMTRLMGSRGMPLGLSLHGRAAAGDGTAAPASSSSPSGTAPPSRGGGGGGRTGSGGSGGSAPSSSGRSTSAPSPRAAAEYPMEALEEIMQSTLGQGGAAAGAGAAGGAPAGAPAGDSWGTTRESSSAIARRIAESNTGQTTTLNEELEAAAAEADRAAASAAAEDDDLTLSPDELKYKTLEAMSADIKNLDEVFEVLASVPWLDEDDVDQKALKGMARLSLLGTLEEVGFNIGDQVRRIWGGERDHGIILEGTSAKDQAALISVMFHTKLIEDEHGPPDGVPIPRAVKPSEGSGPPPGAAAAPAGAAGGGAQ